MSLKAVIEGIEEQLKTTGLETLLRYEPTSVQRTPLVYCLLDNVRREPAGSMLRVQTRVRVSLTLQNLQPEVAEEDVREYAESVPAAIQAAPRLGGRVKDSAVEEVDAGWRVIGGTQYRVVDFYIVTLEYAPLGAL